MQTGNINIFERMQVVDNEKSLSSFEGSRENSKTKMVNKNQIFVGAIPADIKETELTDHFEQFGRIIDIRHVKPKPGAIMNSKSSKAFAFITYDTAEAVQQAVSDEHFLRKKRLECTISKKKNTKKPPETDIHRKVYCGGLSDRTEEKDLEEFFCQFGSIKGCHIIYDFETNRSRGFAFIEFYSEESAKKALTFEGKPMVANKVVYIADSRERQDDKKKNKEDSKYTKKNSELKIEETNDKKKFESNEYQKKDIPARKFDKPPNSFKKTNFNEGEKANKKERKLLVLEDEVDNQNNSLKKSDKQIVKKNPYLNAYGDSSEYSEEDYNKLVIADEKEKKQKRSKRDPESKKSRREKSEKDPEAKKSRKAENPDAKKSRDDNACDDNNAEGDERKVKRSRRKDEDGEKVKREKKRKSEREGEDGEKVKKEKKSKRHEERSSKEIKETKDDTKNSQVSFLSNSNNFRLK